MRSIAMILRLFCRAAGLFSAMLLFVAHAFADVDEFGVAKLRIFEQNTADPPAMPDSFLLVANVAASPGDTTFVTLNGVPLFEDEPGIWEFDAAFSTQMAFDAAYPIGTTYDLDLLGGVLGDPSESIQLGAELYPAAPALTHSSFYALQSVDVGEDLIIEWNAPDANTNIVLLAIYNTATGAAVFDESVLVSQTSFLVPKNTLQPNQPYEIDLAFGNVDQFSGQPLPGGFGDAEGTSGVVSETQIFFTAAETGLCCLNGSLTFDTEASCAQAGGSYLGPTGRIGQRSIPLVQGFTECTCGVGPSCTNPVGTLSDGFGNRFEIRCISQNYFVLVYIPFGGAERFVGKCPWYGGRNLVEVTYFDLDEDDAPDVFLRSYWRSRDTGCDDFPPQAPDGFIDWVEYRFDVCSSEVEILHFASTTGEAPGFFMVPPATVPAPFDTDFASLHPPVASTTCQPLVVSNSRIAMQRDLLGPGDGPMSPEHAVLRIDGTAQGGSVDLWLGQAHISIGTAPGELATTVAGNLVAAINSDPMAQLQGYLASANGPMLVVAGLSRGAVSYCPADPGLVSPPALTNVLGTGLSHGMTLIEWDIPAGVQYDEIYVSMSNEDVGFRLPGNRTSLVDMIPRIDGSRYSVVGYVADTASCAVTLEAPRPARISQPNAPPANGGTRGF